MREDSVTLLSLLTLWPFPTGGSAGHTVDAHAGAHTHRREHLRVTLSTCADSAENADSVRDRVSDEIGDSEEFYAGAQASAELLNILCMSNSAGEGIDSSPYWRSCLVSLLTLPSFWPTITLFRCRRVKHPAAVYISTATKGRGH
jgi:hypothetical protein